jgi:AraC-type DNA-binding domain-containing proteins
MSLKECRLNLSRDCQELQPHGTLDFPCAGYSLQYSEKVKDIIPWHWHEEIEVIYSIDGNLNVQIPGKVFHMKQGESIFINSNILHMTETESYCNYHSIVFHPLLITGTNNSIFAKRYITPLIHFAGLDGIQFTSKCQWEQNITEDIMVAFQAIASAKTGYEITVRENLSKVCLSLYQQYENAISEGHDVLSQDTIRLRKMLDYIHEHYAEHLELPQIAKAADIGDRECLRCFQRLIKTSPVQYLIKHRVMQGASILIRNNDISITDVSILCGFDSPSNFSQMFKRFFRCTPREYRNQYEQSGI